VGVFFSLRACARASRERTARNCRARRGRAHAQAEISGGNENVAQTEEKEEQSEPERDAIFDKPEKRRRGRNPHSIEEKEEGVTDRIAKEERQEENSVGGAISFSG
jgi:hypothetical protein